MRRAPNDQTQGVAHSHAPVSGPTGEVDSEAGEEAMLVTTCAPAGAHAAARERTRVGRLRAV
jgi:hypothetical protein